MPPGVLMVTSSPSSRPISARPTGLRYEMRPCSASISSSPTVMAELRNIGYDGTLIHEVGGEHGKQVEMAERMRRIVAL